MSRIGKAPIPLPDGVEFKYDNAVNDIHKPFNGRCPGNRGGNNDLFCVSIPAESDGRMHG